MTRLGRLARDVRLAVVISTTAYVSIALSVTKAIVDHVTGAGQFYATLDELGGGR